jgi:diguanylate cyclase (GGDEF)-like protein/PAS domain S-box-containing protein
MQTYLHPYTIYSIISALISLVASIIAWRRSAPGSFTLSLLLLSMAIWSGFYSTRWMDISIESKVFWFNLMYIGVAAVPTLFLVFAAGFTHHEAWLTPRNMLLLSIQPVISLLLQWTNRYHHLLYLSLTTVQQNSLSTLEFIRGPWYFANVAYSYVLVGIALGLLLLVALRSGLLYQGQYRLILLASLIPWASSIYSEYNFNALRGLDLVPLTFGLSGIIFAYSIRYTRFMDLLPIARGRLIEYMHDGVLVLDLQHRIVDINPAMKVFLDNKTSSYLGKNALEIFGTWIEKTDSFVGEVETRTELRAPSNPSHYLDLRVTPLYDNQRQLNGRLMVFRDITDRKQVEKTLRYVNNRLQSQLIEIGILQSKIREQAIRDPLTNLFNRRYLEETLDRELARAAREEYPVCIIMMDLDHFKKVNDTYGHEAGDHVLKALADILSEQSRRGDFACRFGGEEFVIVMPNINLNSAYERAEDLRESLNSLSVPYGPHNLTITISMGIACYPINGETREAILRAADRAMYAVKDAGRDHILSYDQLEASDEALED